MSDQPHDPAGPTPDEPTPGQPTSGEVSGAEPSPPAPPQEPAPPAAPPQQVPPPVPPVVGGQSYVGNPGAYPGWTGPGQAYPPPAQAYPPPAQGYPQQGQGYPQQGQGYPQQGQGSAPPPANPYGGYAQAPVYAGGGPAVAGSLAYVEQNFGKVADFGQRALAYLIDFALSLIGLVPMAIGGIMLAVAVSESVTTDQFGNTTTTGDVNATLATIGGLLIALGAITSLVITIWNRVFKMGRTGQSVGKKAIGLYLLDDKTGHPIGAGMCFLRELVNSLINQVIYLGWLWMLWDADKQTLGDKAVHSSVVVVRKA